MGKTVNRKKNIKKRRTIRRTVGALLMVTAITVAAIPIPETQAYDPTTAADKVPTYENIPSTDDATKTVHAAAQQSSLKMADKFSDLTLTGKTYTVSTIGNISYLDWQFEYACNSGYSNGFVTNYNSEFRSGDNGDTLTVGSYLFLDYLYVDATQLSSFYNREPYTASMTKTMPVVLHVGSTTVSKNIEKLGIEYTITGNPFNQSDPSYTVDKTYTMLDPVWSTSEEYKFMSTNFPADLDNYISEYRLYLQGQRSAVPADVVKAKFDLPAYNTSDKQDQFVCESLLSKETGVNMTVVPIRMYTYEGGTRSTKNIYLIKVTDSGVTVAQTLDFKTGFYTYTDENKYLTTNFIRVVGFKENSLENVSNVTNLVLEDNVRYICDKAFYNSRLLKSVTLPTDVEIGNQAFALGGALESVTLGEIKKIPKEAFYGTKIRSIVIPESVTSIEDGAFAKCASLQTVTFADGPLNDEVIKAGAFADCDALTSVDFGNHKIKSIGTAAFAICDTALTGKDKLTNFKYPDYVERGAALGEFCLGGREALETVTLSNGLTATEVLPDTLVAGCKNLSWVKFPDSCTNVGYDSTMFYDVVNPNFYVEGPATNGTDYATPRKNTWTAKMDVASGRNTPVTYKCLINGVETYEVYQLDDVSGKGFILGVDINGNMVNCTFDPANPPATGDLIPITIPASVAGISVVAIDSNCFGSEVLPYMKSLTVQDGCGVTKISPSAFKGSSIEELDLGDSITEIGANAFEGCTHLTKATIGENIAKIETAAFKGCNNLVDIYFDTPTYIDDFTIDDIEAEALSTGSNKLTVHGEVTPTYGPFAWAMQDTNFVDASKGIRVLYATNAPSSQKIILDNTTLYPTLVDYPHFEQLPNDLQNKVNTGGALTNDEQDLLNATTKITVPAGVKSIDVKGYITRPATDSVTNKDNAYNVQTYLTGLDYFDNYEAHGLFNGYSGLYNAGSDTANSSIVDLDNINDYANSSSDHAGYEKQAIGNDRITDIILNNVVSLPDKAFESCEKLKNVDLGDAMKDVGSLPFYQCTDLSSVACGSGEYTCENGILYQNDTDGSKKIVECLAGRGTAVGETTVSVTNDPLLADVDEIAEAAFSDCDIIKYVYFKDVDNLAEIPKDCFRDCDNLKKVDLPSNVGNIEDYAFKDISSDVEVTARNKNVVLSTNAFDGTTTTNSPSYITYADAPSRIYAKKAGVNVDETLDDVFTVEFYNIDGTILIGSDLVEKGGQALQPDDEDIPVIEGYTFTGWNKSIKNVQSDMWVLALYSPNPDTTPGLSPGVTPGVTPGSTTPGAGTPGAGTPGVTSSVTPTGSAAKHNLKVVYGSGTGSYAEGTQVIIEAIDAPEGKEFDKWVMSGSGATIESATSKATTIKMGSSDVTVTATYKNKTAASSNNGGGSRNSTGTTNRNGTNSGTSSRNGNNGTTIDITKPGVSNTDKAYASVSGSTDSFIVRVTESADAANRVATALAAKYPDMSPIKYFAMDISLYDSTGTNKITDTTGLSVNITMPIPDALAQYAGNNKVGAVNDANALEDLGCKFTSIDGIPCVSFTATHFSPYTIYVDTANLTSGTIDYTPKTGDAIHPKWFVALALAATSLFLFFKRDKKIAIPKTV